MQIKIVDLNKYISTESSQIHLNYDFLLHFEGNISNVKITRKMVDLKRHEAIKLQRELIALIYSLKNINKGSSIAIKKIKRLEKEFEQKEITLRERDSIEFQMIDTIITLRQFSHKNGWEDIRTKSFSSQNSFHSFDISHNNGWENIGIKFFPDDKSSHLPNIEKSFDFILDSFEDESSVMAKEFAGIMIPNSTVFDISI